MSPQPQPGRPIVSSQANADKIRNGPSMSFDPKMVESIENYNDDTRGYVESARSAFQTGKQSLDALWDAMREVSASTAWSTDRKLIELAGAARRVQDRMLKAFQSASDTLSRSIAHVEGELNKPLDGGAAHSAQATEIRNMVRREMSESERREFIARAIKDNDSRVVHAVLGGVPALSGLDPVLHAYFLRQYREATAPDLAKRLGVMQKARERIDQVGPLTFTEVETVLHQIEEDNTGLARGVWDRVERVEAKHKAARGALDRIP